LSEALPAWTLFPFIALVLAMAGLPLALPHLWEKRAFQALIVAACALPVALFLNQHGLRHELKHGLADYTTFIATLGALYVAAGGVFANADLKATPAVNVAFLLGGSLLASVIGTTGASMLAIRPSCSCSSSDERHFATSVVFRRDPLVAEAPLDVGGWRGSALRMAEVPLEPAS
jgi:hypothetical protein